MSVKSGDTERIIFTEASEEVLTKNFAEPEVTPPTATE
jgi:hypothetical protein